MLPGPRCAPGLRHGRDCQAPAVCQGAGQVGGWEEAAGGGVLCRPHSLGGLRGRSPWQYLLPFLCGGWAQAAPQTLSKAG